MNSEPLIWLDGEPANTLPLPDRGFSFGDGVFETLLVHQGIALYLSEHLDRMRCGLETLGIPFPNVLPEQINDFCRATSSCDWPWASLRVTVTRGTGPRGYAPPSDGVARVVAEAGPLTRAGNLAQSPASLGLAELRLSHQPVLAGLKHLNRLEQVLAARERTAAGSDELIVLDQSGDVVSVIAGNLFLRVGDRLRTPSVNACGVAGTRRRIIMERWAPECGLSVTEEKLGLDDVTTADEVFYSSSLVTVRAVAALGDRTWSDHSAANALFERFRAELC